MDQIDALKLRDYKEEPWALQRFERRYLLVGLVGVIAFVAGFILAMSTAVIYHLGFCVLGWAAVTFAALLRYRATPRSDHSGRPMQKFRYVGPDAAAFEVAYVDHESKTYFRRIFARR